MRYYDTTIKNITIIYITGMGQYKGDNIRNIEVTKETSRFIYGVAWDGRYKFDKKQNKWYKYEYYNWHELNIKEENK